MSERASRSGTALWRSVLSARVAGWCAGAACALWTAGAAAQVQVIAPEPQLRDPSTFPDRHQVKNGETLSMIAEQYLGTGDAWPKLWSYNPQITNPHYIYPGLVLKLKSGVSDEPGAPAEAGGDKSEARRTLTFAARRTNTPGMGTVVFGERMYLDRQALDQAGIVIGGPEDHMWASPSDEVYLKFKDGVEPVVGKEYTVFLRWHRAELNPRASKQRIYKTADGGELVHVQGGARVLRYDPSKHIATAVVTEAVEGIERGFEVADVPRTIAKVAPKTNGQDVKANIVAAGRSLGTLGDGQVVFIDAGAKQGVEVGNRFVVVRQGDTWRQNLTMREALTGELRPNPSPPKNSEYPQEVVAELRVLYVRPESATALITSADIEINPGEHVEMRSGY